MREKMTRRIGTALLAVLVAALVAAVGACGGPSPTPTAQPKAAAPAAPAPTSAPAAAAPKAEAPKAAPTAAPAAKPAAPPAAEQKLVYGSAQELPSLEPADMAWVYAGRTILRNLYDPLVQYYGDPAEIKPALAESWKGSQDGLVWTFKLRSGARFHDGSPVTAEAVKYSFDRFLAIKKGLYAMFADILEPQGVKAVDASTIEISLKKPYAPFVSILPYVLVVNPVQVKAHEVNNDLGQGWMKDNEAGSGAFKLKSFQPGTAYVMTAFQEHWRPRPASHVTEVTWRIIRDKATKRLAVQRGEAQVVDELTPEDIEQVKGQRGVKIYESPEIRDFYLHMNNQYGPLKDVNLRRAISYAFDYDGYIKSVLQGKAIQPRGPIPEGTWGGDPSLFQYKQDLNKAKEHLAKASGAQGITLEYLYVNNLEEQRQLGLILQDNLGKLGIQVKMTPLTWPNMTARMAKPETAGDLMAAYTSALYNDPDAFLFNKYHSSQWGSAPASSFYKNARVDELIEKGRTLSDQKERMKLYLEAQQIMIDEAPSLFISQGYRQLALQECVKNLEAVGIGNVVDFATADTSACR